MSTAVHRTESMHSNFMGWIRLIGFVFNGETYEYVFEAGDSRYTERQAREASDMAQHPLRANLNFLRDVPLNMEMPN
jgi:hypothetical protein